MIPADPFHFYLLVLVDLYDNHTSVFWDVVTQMKMIEDSSTNYAQAHSRISGNIRGEILDPPESQMVDFPSLHALAKHVIQIIEVQEVSIRLSKDIRRAHVKIASKEWTGPAEQAIENTAAALDYHEGLFQNMLTGSLTLEKRLSNQINLVIKIHILPSPPLLLTAP
jgi:hypothetical protein